MALVTFKCEQCGKPAQQEAGAVNRARKKGAPIYCDRTCAGLARRDKRTKAERVAAKAIYDADYRKKNHKFLKSAKALYFKQTYDPVKAATHRKTRMPYHVEYCRRPEYQKYKQEYDRRYRAREFGPFAEAYLALMELDREVNARMSDYDVRMANGTINKRQKRRRDYEKSDRL